MPKMLNKFSGFIDNCYKRWKMLSPTITLGTEH